MDGWREGVSKKGREEREREREGGRKGGRDEGRKEGRVGGGWQEGDREGGMEGGMEMGIGKRGEKGKNMVERPWKREERKGREKQYN